MDCRAADDGVTAPRSPGRLPGQHRRSARSAAIQDTAEQPERQDTGEQMTTGSVIHGSFTIERSYLATRARVFAAFASAEAKKIWGDTGDLGEADGDAGIAEFDFRIGGRER